MLAHRAVDAVRTDDDVGLDSLAVREREPPFLHGDDPGSQAHPARRLAAEQPVQQVRAMGVVIGKAEGFARFPAERGLDQRLAFMAADRKSCRLDAPFGHVVFQAEPIQDARRVGADLDAGADRLDVRRLLQHESVDAALRQRERCGQPAYSGADDNDP